MRALPPLPMIPGSPSGPARRAVVDSDDDEMDVDKENSRWNGRILTPSWLTVQH